MVELLNIEESPEKYTIEFIGRERVEIIDQKFQVLGYWKGVIQYYDEQPSNQNELSKIHQTLEAFLINDIGKERYEELQKEGSIPLFTDPLKQSFWIAEMLPDEHIFELERKKQELLTLRSTVERMKTLLLLLQTAKEDQIYKKNTTPNEQ